MLSSPQLIKPLKRYLRRTWLYPAKLWIDRHSPRGTLNHENFLTLYSQFIKQGDLCFDIGANIGNRTAIFVELGAKTICCEPQTVCLQRLHQCFDRNPNVVIVDKAVGSNEGFAELAICEDASTISTLSERWRTRGRFSSEYEWTKTQTVAVTTLDKLIEIYGLPQFCKIDVEGFEVSVLKGLSQPIPYLSFEFNIELMSELSECVEHLQAIADTKFNYSIAETMKLAFPNWVSADQLLEQLSQTEDQLLWGDIYAKFVG